MRAAVQALGTVDGDHIGADALDVGAHLEEHARQVLHVRLAGGVADDGRTGCERRGHEDVLGCHHRGLVHEDIVGTEAARGGEDDLAVAVDVRAHGAEGVEVRIEAAPSDHIAARGRHHGTAEAREQGSREQEGCANQLGELGLHLDLAHAGGAECELVGPAPADINAEAAQDVEHRVDVADARHVSDVNLLVGEHRRGEDRQGAVLVAGGRHRPRQWHAAFDEKLLHELYAPASAPAGVSNPAGRVGGAPGKRNSHVFPVRVRRPAVAALLYMGNEGAA